MIKNFNRILKVSKEIKREISLILQKSIHDPRINFIITISNIELSRDFSKAKIFVNFLENNKKNIKNIINILQGAAKYIRNLLSKRMILRKVPIITFYYDEFFTNATRIFKVIEGLNVTKVNV
ncbi:ribosome-binding factor A [Buchnera aphidicola (Nipponaphis monzeni)]|uniref:Ribosome-binding factor A n=1 Tax=Buchnera aphidicola (Nipponaphis monzeni) TaxID=2495405 RepID=A0A455TAD8_9GAMM|nr:30S ribosome-binding factor RbfA [Buchnera aphidicola]BBI01296.1 ribosome-binding factor A [Buchnera aphidicola (Nipponaphis monzeni)]